MPFMSPCISICVTGSDGYCDGCLRTVEEIATWAGMTYQEQLHIMTVVIPERDHQRQISP